MVGQIRKSTLLLMLIASPLAAQYIAPGSTQSPDERPYPEENLRTEADQAAWRRGVLRLSPWLGLSDLSLVSSRNELGETESDVTAAAGGGIRAYLKTGRKVIWAAHVLPEYVFWKDNKLKEGWNGRFGTGLFAYGNRLDLEASWHRSERQSFFSSEIRELTTVRDDISRLVFDLELHPHVSLVGGYTLTGIRSQEGGSFSALDRDEGKLALRLLVRTAGWRIGAGFEDRTADFTEEARDLSYEGETGLFHLSYEGTRFALRLEALRLSLTPQRDSVFVPFEDTTGHLETLWNLGKESSLFLYANRRLDHSVLGGVSNVLAERLGSRLNFKLFKLRLGLTTETGNDEYRNLAGTTRRLDDVFSYAGVLGFELWGFAVHFQAVRSEYDSSFDAFDRDVVTWGLSIELGALRKFALGEGDRLW